MVRCGFSRFVTDSCGQSIASSECVSLSQCTRDIRPHLKGFNVIDASLKSEIQLLWARAGSILLLTFSPHNLMFYTRALYRRFLGKYDLFFAPGSLGSTACREDPRLGYPARSDTWGAYTICQNKPVGMTVE